MSKDYYNILGIGKNASQDEVKKAFRKMAHQYHPDKVNGNEAKFKEVNEAYQVLGDTKRRAQYDQYGSAFENARAGGGFSGFEGFRDFAGFANGFSAKEGPTSGWSVNIDDLGDIFSGFGDIFGGAGRRTATQTERGNDIQAILTVDFKEAVFGAEKEISLQKAVTCDRCQGKQGEPGSKITNCKICGGSGRITRVQRTILGNLQVQTTCSDCRGEGKTYDELCKKCHGPGVVKDTIKLKVKIPAGIDEDEIIRLSGQGEAGQKGAPAGDLYIKVRVKPDIRFEREGDTIKSQIEISFTQAVLGDKIEIKTVHGPVKLKIPAGTQSGTVFKLRGKGVPRLQGSGQGDHFVTVNVQVPKDLTKKQKQQLRELGL